MSSNKAKFRKRERLAAGAIAGGSVLGTLGLQAAPASAVPFPGNSKYSYYITTWTNEAAYSLGCGVANRAANDNVIDALAILDFGGQKRSTSSSTGWGVWGVGSSTFHPDYAVRAISKNFVSGFWDCRNQRGFGGTLRLGIGTNNSTSDVNSTYDVVTAAGQAWGNNVNEVADSVSATSSVVAVYGANDIEPGFGAFVPAVQWAYGYGNRTWRPYMNFGSADSCPESGGNS